MNSTIEINGRTFTVNAITDTKNVPYRLDGVRGATYFAIRTQNKPDQMFLIASNPRGIGRVNPLGDGLYLTDADGTLKVR